LAGAGVLTDRGNEAGTTWQCTSIPQPHFEPMVIGASIGEG
jgi:hypothetical protein